MSSPVESLPVVERWALLIPSERRLLATPDSPIVVLTGSVQGDPRFPNGAAIVTSRVLELDPTTALARTRNARYRLGRRAGSSCGGCASTATRSTISRAALRGLRPPRTPRAASIELATAPHSPRLLPLFQSHRAGAVPQRLAAREQAPRRRADASHRSAHVPPSLHGVIVESAVALAMALGHMSSPHEAKV